MTQPEAEAENSTPQNTNASAGNQGQSFTAQDRGEGGVEPGRSPGLAGMV